MLDEGVRRVLRTGAAGAVSIGRGGLRRRRAPHARPTCRPPISGAAQRRRRAAAAAKAGAPVAVIGEFARSPALSGRRRLQVNPDPGRHPAGRADRGSQHAGERGLSRRLHPGRGRGRSSPCSTRPSARPPGPTTCSSSSGCPCRSSPRVSTETTWTYRRDRLLPAAAVSAVHDSVVVVLVGGSTVPMSTSDYRAAAILNCCGLRAGLRVLWPTCSPGSPTPPEHRRDRPRPVGGQLLVPQLSSDPEIVRYGEGVLRRLPRVRQSIIDVSYPFSSALVHLVHHRRRRRDGLRVGGGRRSVVAVSATVTDVGEVAGAEVVQVYVGDRGPRSRARSAS